METPLTTAQWMEWFHANKDDFARRMRTAPERRRQLSKRLRADSSIPAPADRAAPEESQPKKPRAGWVRLLWGRNGWYSVHLSSGQRKTLCVYYFRYVTYAMDVGTWQRGRVRLS